MCAVTKTFFCIFLMIFCSFSWVYAEKWYPENDWQDTPDPVASPFAERGGQLNLYLGQYPKSLNHYLEASTSAGAMFGLMYEPLLDTDPLTLDYAPGIASKWSVSDDGTVITFVIDPNAYWSDGVKITAHDVLWTYDMLVKPENLTGQFKTALLRFDRPEVLADDTIRFTAKEAHWKNLLFAGSYISVMPKHAFENADFNKINFEFPVVSGPYMLESVSEGTKITLARRDNWWAGQYEREQNKYNFDRLAFQFFADSLNAFDIFKKGLTDVYTVSVSRVWMDETKGERFSKNWIVKQAVYNFDPPGFQGFAMNMRAFPFDDPNVRKAMNLLIDRQEINKTIMYDQYFLHRSYNEDLFDKDHPHVNPLYEKNVAEAKKLLADAGYKANPQTGFLEKDGRRLSFKFLSRDNSMDNILAMYAESLKNVGIEMVIDQKDWAAWLKDMDEHNYQMTTAAWTTPVFRDPEAMWSSKEADIKSSININGFKNARVDELIEKQRTIFDMDERNVILREIDALVFSEHPYVLLWNINYSRLLYWNKFGTPPTVFGKYSNEYAGIITYWWYDENAAEELEAAMADGLSLPAKPAVVKFEEVFKP